MNPYYYVLSVNGLLFILSLVFYFFPPKKINKLYGYRTHKSMQNEDIWQFANRFSAKQLVLYSGISFVAAMVLIYLNPVITWRPMAIMLLSLVVAIIKTEQTLDKNFDDKGKRK